MSNLAGLRVPTNRRWLAEEPHHLGQPPNLLLGQGCPGSKRHVETNVGGVPMAAAPTAAHVHGSNALEKLVHSIWPVNGAEVLRVRAREAPPTRLRVVLTVRLKWASLERALSRASGFHPR